MMNEMWSFMGGFGMLFMLMFWFLVMMGFITVLKWLTGNVNTKQCRCKQPVNHSPGNEYRN